MVLISSVSLCQTQTNERNHSSSRQRRRLRRRRKAFQKASNGHEATEKDVTRSESDSYKTELEVQERRSVESSVNSSKPRSFTGNSVELDMDASLCITQELDEIFDLNMEGTKGMRLGISIHQA